MVIKFWILISQFYNYFVFFYFIMINLVYLLLLLISLPAILEYVRKNKYIDYLRILQSEFSPPISVLVPAYNEEKTIIDSVQALLKLKYSKFEVIVVNDGSSDGTLQKMIANFNLVKVSRAYQTFVTTKAVRGIYKSSMPAYNKLIVVDKENGGKADALNCGVNVARSELICAIDADSLLEQDSLLKVVKPYLEDTERTVAVGGIVRIVNGCKVNNGYVEDVRLSNHFLPVFQVVEYLRAFLTGRIGWSAVGGLLVISGAFGLFRRSTIIECGGYNPHTVGEDMELVVRIHRTMRDKRRDYKIVFVPDPVCWTEAPEDIRTLRRQRNRWHRGLIDTIRIHKKMILNPAYGVVGLFSVPYFVFFEVLGPIIEISGVFFVSISFVLGRVNAQFFISFLVVAILYGVFLSVGAILLEEYSFHRYPNPGDLLKLVLFGIIENFGYRQMTAWWRLKATYDYMRGETAWGMMSRVGFEDKKR
ncbi:MAG: glycosyltransferase family 2 protein [Candidatus Kryptoniota bacterium]